MKIYRPLWSEGVLLSPQQFQQQTEWESFRSAGISALASPFPWGVETVELNDSLLSSGLIQITQLRLWLEDGTLIDAQRSDLPPAPRELDAGQLADHRDIAVHHESQLRQMLPDLIPAGDLADLHRLTDLRHCQRHHAATSSRSN